MPFGFSTIVIVIVILYLLSAVKILAEYERGVIFRLGRLLGREKGPGIILVFAPIDRIVRISPSRFECAKADFDAFVAERCEMISSLVNRLCDRAPRKAGDGPVGPPLPIKLTNSSSRTAARPRFPASPPDGSTACCPRGRPR